ncbi:hypothetical protein [Hephaestia mangrovi]|uniref:hypothetical protein n=1 Tax=Hephaestia mangrovi TaxID=2873268 RepID=UPI001CA63062|nr:hypothetical protein [Hephaestia mangrovi]MBY8828843.1 hypothetical protein [Hephaestia mangrovi]
MSSGAVEDLVVQVRDHYVDQFRVFVAQQRKTCRTGCPEVKFSLPEDNAAFQRLVVVDFVRNDAGPEAVFFEPKNALAFNAIECNIETTKLVVEELQWDQVLIKHDAPQVEDIIRNWFDKWFDVEERRFDSSSDISNCIHSIYIEPGELQVDLGTAPPEAFWELLHGLAAGNANRITVR